MEKIKIDFEQFITERFLDFYNERESTNFVIKEKADEKEREKSIYDFHCIDESTEKEMAIELKRLFPKEKTHIQNIINWVHTYVEKPLKGKIKGDYFLLIKAFESPFRLSKKNRVRLLNNIKNEIGCLETPIETYNLNCYKGISLMKSSDEGSGIQAWPVSFASADDEEIVRILDASLRKFESKKNEEIINIILLVELSSASRRTEIASIIKDLKHGFEPDSFNAKPRNFDLINGIYHIGIHKDTVIAQVYPGNKIFESGFFTPSDFMEISKFRQWTIENLL